MNKRIKKLAEQAGLDFESYDRYGLFNEEYFAELIVQECIRLCGKQIVGAVGTYPGAHNNAVNKCMIAIKDQFGVEE